MATRSRGPNWKGLFIYLSALVLVLGAGLGVAFFAMARLAPALGGSPDSFSAIRAIGVLALLVAIVAGGTAVGAWLWLLLASYFLTPRELRVVATQPYVPVVSPVMGWILKGVLRLRGMAE